MSGSRPLRLPWVLAGLFFRAGSLTFGGGTASSAELHRELVTKRGILSESQFKLCYALARLTPGTNSLAFCVGAGSTILSWPGALIALFSISIPSAAITLLLTSLYETWSSRPLMAVTMRGIMAGTIGIIAATAWGLVRPAIVSGQWVRAVLFVSGGILLNVLLSLSPLQVLALAAMAGLLTPQREK